MTMPTERTRALLWAGGFLIELARDKRLPVEVRRRAVVITRHFPTKEDVTDLALLQPVESGGPLAPAGEVAWKDDCKYGPLLHGSRFGWPEWHHILVGKAGPKCLEGTERILVFAANSLNLSALRLGQHLSH